MALGSILNNRFPDALHSQNNVWDQARTSYNSAVIATEGASCRLRDTSKTESPATLSMIQ